MRGKEQAMNLAVVCLGNGILSVAEGVAPFAFSTEFALVLIVVLPTERFFQVLFDQLKRCRLVLSLLV